jgi:4-amino-4-deoxy-L-arabinose transferase-like glycosyltransferase
VQAQIARTMLDSGDWVTAHLDGVRYFEKAPLKYWLMAVSYMVFGVRDWVARFPIVLGAVLLCWLTYRVGRWAFDGRAGFFSGVAMATCIGMWLFTRVLIPDVLLTLAIALALWAFLRALEDEETHPRVWAAVAAASVGAAVLLKGMIGVVFPVAAAAIYLAIRRQLFTRETWRRLHPVSGVLLFLAIAAPWHVLASLRNPPVFYFALHAGPGQYHGFFWFYFFNEHILRFLGTRFPVDYNTVPRLQFWLLHLVWLFPWSVFLPGLARLRYRADDRASRTRLLALCWIGFVLVFFTFSTSQEYYSMPCYPAIALLLGCVLTSESPRLRFGYRTIGVVALAAALACLGILFAVRGVPTPGDIFNSLTTEAPGEYTLALAHMGDLTLKSFAYLRFPLALAAAAFALGSVALLRARSRTAWLWPVLMMMLFVHAARIAMIAFEPYLSSRPLANALLTAKLGQLVADDQYYTWSSVFFYANRSGLLLNGRVNNLEYGSNAPGSAHVFIDDPAFAGLWNGAQRVYLLADDSAAPRFRGLVDQRSLLVVRHSGGKTLYTNHANWN